MKLEFIALGNLAVSKSNMRYARKAPDVSDILPTVRARGVLQPILVRPSGAPGEDGQHYEIVAGCRRFHAARIVAAEREEARIGAGELDEPGGPDGPDSGAAMLPCAVLDETDDASAVEASLIENTARLDPDEVSRWACFTRLVKEGRSIAEIGATFGLPDLAVRRAALIDAGWSDAVIVPADEHFHSWEYEKTAKRKGGRVYLDVRGNGEVVVLEGYLSRKDAARLAKGGNAGSEGEGDKPVRAELTSLTQTYVDLHRHAAVRTELLGSPRLALRLMVAHVIAGSALWRVQPEPQAVKSDAVRQSLDECRAEAVFDARRREVLAALGLGGDDATVTGSGYGAPGRNVCSLFARLVPLPDAEVLDILTLVMGETLAAGTPEIEVLGPMLGLSMADWWEADDAFLDGLRDREVLLAMVAEVSGEQIAAANAKEKGKTLKAIIRAHLAGEGGRTKKEGWVPRWMAFPPSAYTPRGGVGTVAAHARAMAAMEDVGQDAGESDGCERASDPTDAALDAEVPVELVGADGSPSDQVTTQQAA